MPHDTPSEHTPAAPPALLTPAQRGLLEKLRKGSHTGLTVKSFADLCTVLEGWRIVPMTGYKGNHALSEFGKAVLGRFLGSDPDAEIVMDPDRPGRYSDEARHAVTEGRMVAYGYTQAETEAAVEAFRQFQRDHLPEATEKAAPPLVVTHLGPIVPRRAGATYGHFEFSVQLFALTKFHRIHAPDGQHFDLVADARAVGFQNVRTPEHFLAWATAHTDLLEQVNRLLGTTPHVAKKDQPRTEDHVGTCGICCGQYKSKPEHGDALVTHGYERPGYGYIVGQCFGVGFPPYELSTAALEKYLDMLDTIETRQTAYLADLRAGRIEALVHGRRSTRYTPTDPLWPRVLEEAIRKTEATLAAVAEDRRHTRSKIAAWQYHPEQITRPGRPAEGVSPLVAMARRRR